MKMPNCIDQPQQNFRKKYFLRVEVKLSFYNTSFSVATNFRHGLKTLLLILLLHMLKRINTKGPTLAFKFSSTVSVTLFLHCLEIYYLKTLVNPNQRWKKMPNL